MPINQVLTSADNGGIFSGDAQDATQTDSYLLMGPSGVTIQSQGGNLDITPITSTDTNTTILLNNELTNGGAGGGPITGVNDVLTVDGGSNSLTNKDLFTSAYDAIDGSTISFTVQGNGGTNSVDLEKLSSSTVTVVIGDPASSPAGHNTVTIENKGGFNTVDVGGAHNTVTLNGDASNTVILTGGGATVAIGSPNDDDLFGNTSMVTFAGAGNSLTGGDENFKVSGSTGNSIVTVGDGENTIAMAGIKNQVTVWGGDNTINAGGSGAIVKILGLDGANSATAPTAPDPEDPGVPTNPTDIVTIAGAGDSVAATYENVDILGTGVTSTATISLGNGANMILLRGVGGNIVHVGDGGNSINASGGNSQYYLGDGANTVAFAGNGNNNTVAVTDPTGVGLDKVFLGGATNSSVQLDHAGGVVSGTATSGTTTVTQSGPNAVTVNLGNGTGNITLGDGNDTVNANGDGTIVKAGNGNNSVGASGNNDQFTFGNGNNLVSAGGNTDTFTFGNGNNTVAANGNTDTFTFGNGDNVLHANGNNDIGAFGTPNSGGNNILQATGSGDQWTFNENASSTVKAVLGSNDTLTQTNGRLITQLGGAGDTLNLNGVTNSSGIMTGGNNETIDFTNGAGGHVTLNPSSTGNNVTISGSSESLNNYAGHISLSVVNSTDTVTLDDLFSAGGAAITSVGQMYGLTTALTGGGRQLLLAGGGEINFASGQGYSPTVFKFT